MDELHAAGGRARYQNLAKFKLPEGFRGRSAIIVQLWWLVEATLFRASPQIFYGWRRFLLRLFGAKIGRGVLIRPSASITYPWKIAIGDSTWIGDHTVLYSLGPIDIGANVVISQNSYICAAQHDPESIGFDMVAKLISIGSECWLASDVFVAPGVSIGEGAVVGVRSSVFHDLPGGMIYFGTPARPVRRRRRSKKRKTGKPLAR
jgi:putative colanic acid biosynthesis acetyltransferase WcaF